MFLTNVCELTVFLWQRVKRKEPSFDFSYFYLFILFLAAVNVVM